MRYRAHGLRLRYAERGLDKLLCRCRVAMIAAQLAIVGWHATTARYCVRCQPESNPSRDPAALRPTFASVRAGV
jgi:hypothetical protein